MHICLLYFHDFTSRMDLQIKFERGSGGNPQGQIFSNIANIYTCILILFLEMIPENVRSNLS